MKYLVGDTVTVTTGKEKGSTGSITKLLSKKNAVVVDGINKKVRSIKAKPGQPGSRAEFFAPIDISNIAILDPKTGKPCRVGFKVEGGKKLRISKKSGETIVAGKKGAAKAAAKETSKSKK